MTRSDGPHVGPSEADLMELALHPEQTLPPAVTAHLASCPACRETHARYVGLRTEVTTLPGERAPERDLWPSIAQAMRESSAPVALRRSPIRGSVVRTALAAGIAMAAFLLGRASATSGNGRQLLTPALTADTMDAAERIQEAGTTYLTALAMLGDAGVPRPAQGQGRDVAIATLYGATMELARQGRSSTTLTTVASLLESERHPESSPPGATGVVPADSGSH